MKSYEDKKNDSATFSEYQIKIAVIWWSQFLLGKNEVVSIDEVMQIDASIDNPSLWREMLIDLHNLYNKTFPSSYSIYFRYPVASDDEYSNFIKILSKKIRNISLEEGPPYLNIVNLCYNIPGIIQEAILESAIDIDPYRGHFNTHNEMEIYPNGLIITNNETFSTNPAIKCYGKDTDFSGACLVKITGNKFKLVEINADEVKSNLFTNTKYFTELNPNELTRSNDNPDETITHIYAQLNQHDFKRSEDEFLKLTNKECVDILQDREMIKKFFKPTVISYVSDKKDFFRDKEADFATLFIQPLGDNYYQFSTKPLKVLSAPQEGMAGRLSVSPKDFIIQTDKNNSDITVLKKGCDFKARLCNNKGEIVSDMIYRPGDELPMLSKSPSVTKQSLATSRSSFFLAKKIRYDNIKQNTKKLTDKWFKNLNII